MRSYHRLRSGWELAKVGSALAWLGPEAYKGSQVFVIRREAEHVPLAERGLRCERECRIWDAALAAALAAAAARRGHGWLRGIRRSWRDEGRRRGPTGAASQHPLRDWSASQRWARARASTSGPHLGGPCRHDARHGSGCLGLACLGGGATVAEVATACLTVWHRARCRRLLAKVREQQRTAARLPVGGAEAADSLSRMEWRLGGWQALAREADA